MAACHFPLREPEADVGEPSVAKTASGSAQ